MPATKERETNNIETQAKNQQTNGNSTNIQVQNQGHVEQTGKQEVQTPQGVERTRTGRVYTPLVDIYETNEAVLLVADMPGVDQNSVDVTLEKNVLTIYGHVEWQMPESHNLAYREYGIGDYQRSFTISNQIDWEHIQGTVNNGVLRLTLPKAGPAQTRKIEIKPA
jgi:HSP20 family molecular chaperone IbpA